MIKYSGMLFGFCLQLQTEIFRLSKGTGTINGERK